LSEASAPRHEPLEPLEHEGERSGGVCARRAS
jgi:hypothetical protein